MSQWGRCWPLRLCPRLAR